MHFVQSQICSNVSSTDSPNESRLASLSRQTTQREAKPPKGDHTSQRETTPPKGRPHHPKGDKITQRPTTQRERNEVKGNEDREDKQGLKQEIGYLRMPASKLLLQPPDTSLQLAYTDHASILCTASSHRKIS